MDDIAYVAGLLVIGVGLSALYIFVFRAPPPPPTEADTREAIRRDNRRRIIDRGFLKK
jgi:hypothetical protein